MGVLLRIALTGGIATGKSHCLRRFAALGVPTIDADDVARAAVGPGTEGLEAVVRRFGPTVLDSSGLLDRAALAHMVFADERARHDLEAIVHPAVFAAVENWFRDLESRSQRGEAEMALGVAAIPLLFEAGREGDFDWIVVAACRPDQQLARLMGRDGLTEADARRRIAAQWPVERKRALADAVVDTSGDPDETDGQVTALVTQLRASRAEGDRVS